MHSKTLVRLSFAVLVLLSVATLAQGYVTYSEENEQLEPTEADPGEAREGYTVVTTSERTTDGQRDNALVVYDRNGDVVYYNDSLLVYNDVDPVAGKDATVEYVGAYRLNRHECDATSDCWLNVVERVNLSTGETERVYSQVTALERGQWHDVDRVDGDRLLVADIALDRVFLVNTSANVVEWEWQAQSEFPLEGGGLFPGDWTHVNDVELLPDGRVMVSLRNQDQVVFVDRAGGLWPKWTLGFEDNHETLYEQHNPDYIPPWQGGPAVLVSDSENNRVVEYHWTGNGWVEAWEWEDPHLMWPRDADRLPNGNTLITDSNGGRVLEIDRQGDVVWSVQVSGAYDAERLGTGDESTGGPTADAGYISSTAGEKPPRQPGGPAVGEGPSQGPLDRILLAVKGVVPRLVINGVLYVLPPWIGFVEFTAMVLFGVVSLLWPLVELHWAGWGIRIERPRTS